MRGSFTDVISASIEWTKTLLFRPFDLKKWIALYIIAMLAFQVQGGCKMNTNMDNRQAKQVAESVGIAPGEMLEEAKSSLEGTIGSKGGFPLGLVVFFSVLLTLILVLLVQWLYSVFTFVFIEAIVTNDASFKAPFARNKPLGNSFFAWNVTYGALFLGSLGLIIWHAVRNSSIFGGLGNAMLLFIAGSLVSFFVADLVVLVMYKDRSSIRGALPVAFALFRFHMLDFIKYAFVKLLLSIATAILSGALALAGIIIMLVPAGTVALMLGALYKVTPPGMKFLAAILAGCVGVPVAFALVFLFGAAFLPFPVFHKVFNMKFLAKVEERYNLFREEKDELRKPSERAG
jgi:hypothetical protein